MNVMHADPGGIVSRPALMKLLESGAARPVTLVAAPAGSGKSILVRTWLEHRGPTPGAAWVAVERGERDEQRFWSGVVSSLRAAGVDVESSAPTPEYDGNAVVQRLTSELAAQAEPLVLVIDDVHEVASPDITAQLTYLLEHLPGAVHVVLTSRRDPQLGLHRRRLAGELTEIRSADLRFTLDDARALLSASGVVLSEDDLSRLHERTEGWAAGLRLAAITLSKHPDPQRFVSEFSGSERTVAEYLLAEVLDGQPAHVRRLLMRTSLVERVNGSLGDLLTGGSGSERELRALADAGFFVVALNSESTWFRFHRLFADLLAVQLRHTEPDEVPRLHLAAAHWHAEHGYFVEAISHAQASGDRDLAAGLLIEHYFSLTLDGRRTTAHALLEAFGPDPARVEPEIATVVASEQLAGGSLDQAAAYLALAGEHADAVPDDRRHRFDMALLVTRLSLARRLGDFLSVLDEARPGAVLDQPVRSGYDISMQNDVRALMLMNLGIVEVWSGRVDEGAEHLEEAVALTKQIGRPFLQVVCQGHWAHAMSWDSFARSRVASREAIALAERHGWGDEPVIGPALVTLATALLQTGRLDDAERCLARAGNTLRPDLEPAVGFVLHMVQGSLDHARGRHEAAFARYRDAERLAVRLVTHSPLALQCRGAMLSAMLAQGQQAAVRAALAEMSEPERDNGEIREVRATLALAEDDPQTAVDVLAPALDGHAEVHHVLVVIRSCILDALARDRLDESSAAEAALERALDLAEADSLILPFVHHPCRELLEQHPRHRTAHGAFIAEILDVLSGRQAASDAGAPRAAFDELSDAELRVLRFLPTNLPASGIAGEIYVSVNTVKTHMRHIYAKLDAHSRADAVARARELGLMGRSSR